MPRLLLHNLVRFFGCFSLGFIFLNLSTCKNRSSSDYELNGFSPLVAPQNAEELVNEFNSSLPFYLSEGLLKQKAKEFQEAAEQKLSTSQIAPSTLTMLQEWLYLEIFKKSRTEYFLSTLVYTLAHSELDSKDALALFDELILESMLSSYPDLKEIRVAKREELNVLISENKQRQKIQESLKGAVEGAYLALKFLDKKLEFLKKNFAATSNEYREKFQEIEMSKALIYSSYGLLNTKNFKKNVESFYKAELDPAQVLTERAVNQFNEKFDEFIQKKRNIDDFLNYMSSDVFKSFGEELMKAISLPAQQKFRDRINANFTPAINEILENLKLAISDHKKNILNYDPTAKIVRINLMPGTDQSEYRKWLLNIFKEAPLHFMITKDFPYLSSAATALSDYAAQQLSSDQIRKSTNSFMVAIFTSLTGVGAYRNWNWLGQNGWRLIQLGLFGVDATLAAYNVYQSVGQYHEYQRMYTLSRLNPQGVSLINQIQADTMWRNFVFSSSLAFVSTASSAISLAKFRAMAPRNIEKVPQESYLWSVAKGAWSNDALPVGDFMSAIKLDLRSLSTSLAKLDLSKVTKISGSISLNVSAILVQTMVSSVAMLPTMVKSPISTISPALFNSITGGLVIGVVVAATGKYMEAKGFKLFTKSVEALGIEAPTYWKQSALDPDYKAIRDAELVALEDARGAKNLIVSSALTLDRLEKDLQSSQVLYTERKKLEAMIKEYKDLIKEMLKSQIVRWYRLEEFRSVRSDVFKRLGFGFNASPNTRKPRFITLKVVVAGVTYSHTMTPDQIDDPSEAALSEGVQISKPELDALIQVTSKEGASGNPVVPGSGETIVPQGPTPSP